MESIALGVQGSWLLQTWSHISIPFSEYSEFSEKVLIIFDGSLIIWKKYRDIDDFLQLGLVASFPATNGESFTIKAYALGQ